MESSGKRFAWILFMAIIYAVMPARQAGAAREAATTVEPAKSAPCTGQLPEQWARLSGHGPKKVAAPGPCVRQRLST